MAVLGTALRCIDAHVHLGNLEFHASPRVAMIHYEIAVRIGELSIPPTFGGVLLWGRIYNRPFLRALHNCALCLWRFGRVAEAQQYFERILSLNPNDNQGVRFYLEDLQCGRTWEQIHTKKNAACTTQRSRLH